MEFYTLKKGQKKIDWTKYTVFAEMYTEFLLKLKIFFKGRRKDVYDVSEDFRRMNYLILII